MIKAILFDYYDVLSLSGLEVFVTNCGVDYHGKEIMDLSDLINTDQIDGKEFWLQLAKMCDCTVEEVRNSDADAAANQPLINYIRHNLQGKYKLAILSNISSSHWFSELTDDDLKLFDALNASCRTGYNKPAREAYLLAAESVDVHPSECVLIDDREKYCLGAETVGMKAIQYKDFEQFRRDLEELLELENA